MGNLAYYTNPREDILRKVPRSARTVLDLGCGAGALGASIKRRQEAHIVGVEYIAEQAVKAGEVLDEVHALDLQTQDPPYASSSFDCLIYADVLEHLRDPWAVLTRQRQLLVDGGTVIVSLPNVQFIGVIAGLLCGRWEYRERGVMDRTHLRFFTRRSAIHLIEQAGYHVVEMTRNFRWFDNPASRLHRYARITAPLPWVRDLFTYQYIFVGRAVARL